jgi:hypothetical protein
VPDVPRRGAKGAGQVAADAARGLAELARVAPPAGLAILTFAQTFIRGALVVLIAVLAVKTLLLGQSAVGWLTAAIGAGGLVGGVVATRFVHVTRLGRAFVAGLLLWGLPLAWLALTPAAAVAYLALIVVGIGNAVEDVGLTLLTLAHARRFVRLDGAMPPPGREVELLRRLAMFASLPLALVELLGTELVPREFDAGTVAVREGEHGDLFYLVVAGTAAVSVQGTPRPALGPGDCFGEIALLRDIPRTATVVADSPLRTLALDRESFLVAVAANTGSRAAADALVTERLAAGSPGVAAGSPGDTGGSDAGQDAG